MAYSYEAWLDPEEAERGRAGAPAAAGAAGGAPPAPAGAASSGAGGKFVNFDRMLAANRSGAEGMANTLEANVNRQGGEAQRGIKDLAHDQKYAFESSGATGQAPKNLYNPQEAGYSAIRKGVDATARDAKLAQSQGGREALLKKEHGQQGGYTPGMARLDSALVGGVSGTRFQDNAKRWAGLDAQLTGDTGRAASDVNRWNEEYAASQAAQEKAIAEAKAGAAAADKARGSQKKWDETKQAQFETVDDQARQEIAREGGDPYDEQAVRARVAIILARNNGGVGYLSAETNSSTPLDPHGTTPHL